MTEDLQDRNARLRGKIEQLVDNHPELEAVVNDVALKQPTTASLEKVQAMDLPGICGERFRFYAARPSN